MSRIAGLCSKFMPNIKRTKFFSKNAGTILYSPSNIWAFVSSGTFLLFFSFYYSHPSGCEMGPDCGFHLLFPDD